MTVCKAMFSKSCPSRLRSEDNLLTAKASGLTPFSIKDTQMERVLRSSPVFYSVISVCLFCIPPGEQMQLQVAMRSLGGYQ